MTAGWTTRISVRGRKNLMSRHSARHPNNGMYATSTVCTSMREAHGMHVVAMSVAVAHTIRSSVMANDMNKQGNQQNQSGQGDKNQQGSRSGQSDQGMQEQSRQGQGSS